MSLKRVISALIIGAGAGLRTTGVCARLWISTQSISCIECHDDFSFRELSVQACTKLNVPHNRQFQRPSNRQARRHSSHYLTIPHAWYHCRSKTLVTRE